jgi:predicted PurR-regulated permease PerM
MLYNDRPYTFDRIVRLGITTLICGCLLWLMNYLSDVLIPFVTAFLLAYLLNPIVNSVQHRLRHRGLAVFITIVLVILVVSIAGWLIIPMITKEIMHMSDLLMRVAQDSDLTQRAVHYLPSGLWEKIRALAKGAEIEQIRKLLITQDFWTLLQAAGQKLLPGIWRLIHGAASFFIGLLGLFIILLYVVFLLLDYQRIKNEWTSLIPPAWRDDILEFIREFNDGMNQYFRAQALIAFIVGVLFATGFALIGLPMGILIGLFIGLLNMVPYLQTIGLIPAGFLAVILAIETGGSLWTCLGFTLLVFVVVQIIQDAVLTPRIMGRVTGLSPAMILLSVTIWGKLLGVLGLIIALPMTCLLLAYYRRMLVSVEQPSSQEE